MSDTEPETTARDTSQFPGGFKFEIDPERIEETLKRLRERLRESFVSGRYTKVRLSYRGRALGPGIPLAVFLAGEGVAFWLLSPIAALLVNLGAKAILDVEFVHEADELVQEGLALYLEGGSTPRSGSTARRWTSGRTTLGALQPRHPAPGAAAGATRPWRCSARRRWGPRAPRRETGRGGRREAVGVGPEPAIPARVPVATEPA